MKQRRKRDCAVAAWATVNGISYQAAKTQLQQACQDPVNGVPDSVLRLLVGQTFGKVVWPRNGTQDNYPILQTWSQWLAEHQTGRYLVSVYGLDLAQDKHCVAVVDGRCNDSCVCGPQQVDWYAERGTPCKTS